MLIFSQLSKRYLVKKYIFLSIFILFSVLLGQVKSIPENSFSKLKEEKKEFYQISSLARSTAVEIVLPQITGSGVIVEKKGKQYTILTAWHLFEDIDLEIPFKIRTDDFRTYEINISNIKQIDNLDMAIFTFESAKNYETAKFANISSLKKSDQLFSSGFADGNFYFQGGKVIANAVANVKDGNQLLYTSKVISGMSGGGIFDTYGKLVGINTMSTLSSFEDKSFSYSIGVPNSYFINFKNKNNIYKSQKLVTIDDYLVKATELNNEGGNSQLIVNLLDNKIEFFDKAPHSISSWYLYHRLCLAKSDLKDYVSAKENCLKAFKIKPLDSTVLLNYGIIQSIINDDYGAIITFNKFLKIQPNDYHFLVNRGISKGKIGDIKGGILDLTKAIEIKPNKSDAYFSRAYLKNDLEDYYGAISDYSKSINIEPNNASTYLNRGWAKSKIDDQYGAIADLDKAIKLNPNYLKAFYNRAWIKYKMGDTSGSINDYTKVLELNPKEFSAYINRGNIWYDLGEKRTACEDYKKSIFLGDTETKKWLLTSNATWCRTMN